MVEKQLPIDDFATDDNYNLSQHTYPQPQSFQQLFPFLDNQFKELIEAFIHEWCQYIKEIMALRNSFHGLETILKIHESHNE